MFFRGTAYLKKYLSFSVILTFSLAVPALTWGYGQEGAERKATQLASNTTKATGKEQSRGVEQTPFGRSKPQNRQHSPGQSALAEWEKAILDSTKLKQGGKKVETTTKALAVKAPPPLVAPLTQSPPGASQKQRAKDEAAKGEAELKSGNTAKALTHFTAAYDLDPSNRNNLDNIHHLSLKMGNQEQALKSIRDATVLAAAEDQKADVTQYNNQLSEILSALPPWMDEKLTTASAVPNDKASVSATWSNLLEQALSQSGEGNSKQALDLGKQAVDLAKGSFGPNHASTILSEREVGTIYIQNGDFSTGTALLQSSIAKAEAVLGATHTETLAAKTKLADLLESQIKLAETIQLREGLVQSYAQGVGKLHPLTLQAATLLASSFQNAGRLSDALPLLQETCQHFRDVFGFYHLETGRCVQQFADLKKNQGTFAEAQSAYEQALAIFAKSLAANDEQILGAQVGLADSLRLQGKFADSLKLLQDTVASAKKSTNPADSTRNEAQIALARVYTDTGDFDQAESLTKTLLTEHKTNLGNDHPSTIVLLADLAAIQEKQGRFTEAESALQEALTGYQKIFGEAHPSTVTILNNLGQVQEAAGLYDLAEPSLRKALTLAEKMFGENHPTTLKTLNNLALLYESQGNFDKAEPLYQRAIDTSRSTLGKRHTDTAAVINNLAYLHLLSQNYARAEPLFQSVLEIWVELYGESHQRSLKALNNLARTAHHLSKLPQAEKLFLKALRLRSQTLGVQHVDTLRSMHDLGSLYIDMHRYEEAEKLLRRTLELDNQVLGQLHPYTFETLNSLARLLELKPDIEEAFQVRQEGFSRRTTFLDRMLWSTGDNAREGYVRLHRPELDSYIALLSRLDPATSGRGVMDVSIKRKGLLLKVTSEIQQIAHMVQDPQLQDLSDRLASSRKKLASLTLSGPTIETKDRHFQIVYDLEKAVDELQMALGNVSKRFRRAVTDISVNQLPNYLPKGAVLIDFMVFKDGSKEKMIAGILTKKGSQPVFNQVVYPNLQEIQKAVLDYRAAIQDDDADNDEIMEVGQWAFGLIWKPLLEKIADSESVYVVPDGILNILPFPALVDANEQYLAQTTDLHILSSSRDLFPSDVPEASENVVILAGPDYDSENVVAKADIQQLQGKRNAAVQIGLRALASGMRGLRFDPLPGAEKEGRLISKEADSKKKSYQIFVKGDAQERVFRTFAKPPGILHIATHGFFLKEDDSLRKRLIKLQRSADVQIPPPGDNPLLRSGLAFAGVNANAQFLGEIDTDNDGVLTALEVLGQDFTGTRLAVLSACETGLGEIHDGEGVYGLRRAFQEAGVSHVIASLWEVSDAGTQALMTSLYRRLGEGMGAHQALRETQLEMLESDEWRSPYIWSAFMMVGR